MKAQVLFSLYATAAVASPSLRGLLKRGFYSFEHPNGPVVDAPAIKARQDIEFDLIDDTPDPKTAPDNSAHYNPATAIAAVVSDIKADPLPQDDTLQRRDIRVVTSSGYTDNVALGNAAINAPRDCNDVDTYMGVKIFTSGPFDTTLCAAACSAQSAYNLRNPPKTGFPRTCQFYQTYESYKNGVYQGQYCALYTTAWDASYATNTGQYRGSDRYTIQNAYMATNTTSDGKPTVCQTARGCANPYWSNRVSCGYSTSSNNLACFCNRAENGLGYCTEDETDSFACMRDVDCGFGGRCMIYDRQYPQNGGVCALPRQISACAGTSQEQL